MSQEFLQNKQSEQTPKLIRIPLHSHEFIESLSDGSWMNHPSGNLLDNRINPEGTGVYVLDTYQDAFMRSVTNTRDNDRKTIQDNISKFVIPLLGENGEAKFKEMWQKIISQATRLTNSSKFSGSGSNCNSDVTMQAGTRFVNDAILYYFYKKYLSGQEKFHHIKKCWDIWRSGYGVAGERYDVNGTIIYGYKKLL